MSVSSPRTRLIPGKSQGIVTDKTVGVAAHASPIALRRLSTSLSPKVSDGSANESSGPILGSYSGLPRRSSTLEEGVSYTQS